MIFLQLIIKHIDWVSIFQANRSLSFAAATVKFFLENRHIFDVRGHDLPFPTVWQSWFFIYFSLVAMVSHVFCKYLLTWWTVLPPGIGGIVSQVFGDISDKVNAAASSFLMDFEEAVDKGKVLFRMSLKFFVSRLVFLQDMCSGTTRFAIVSARQWGTRRVGDIPDSAWHRTSGTGLNLNSNIVLLAD